MPFASVSTSVSMSASIATDHATKRMHDNLEIRWNMSGSEHHDKQ